MTSDVSRRRKYIIAPGEKICETEKYKKSGNVRKNVV